MLLDTTPPGALRLPEVAWHHYVIHVIVGNFDPSDQAWATRSGTRIRSASNNAKTTFEFSRELVAMRGAPYTWSCYTMGD